MKTIRILSAFCVTVTFFAANAYTKEMRKDIILSSSNGIMTAPVWIAENKGYFQHEGLNVKIRQFNSGKVAFVAMLNEPDIDISTVADMPIVFHSFEKNDFVIIAAFAYSDLSIKILARQDKGIKKPLDLIGKKIGMTKGTAAQFFLNVFLTYKGIVSSKVKTIDLKPPKLPQALADGHVDAICVWEPHIFNARKLIGEKALIMSGEGIQRMFFYMTAKKIFVKNNPETIRSFLKAIQRSEEFIEKNEKASIRIVSHRLKTNIDLAASIWGNYSFQLMLDQMILPSLEDIARWAIKLGFTTKKEIPDYLEFIDMDALESVRPEAVTIIR